MRYPDFAGGGCKSPQERLCLIRCLSLLDVISFDGILSSILRNGKSAGLD